MSVTVTKDEGETVDTIWYDRKNMLPPGQIQEDLCFSPRCCSVNRGLMKSSLKTHFGTIQIMLGLFTIALGPGRPSLDSWDLNKLFASYWLGAVYTTVGTMSIVAGNFPSRCLVGFSVLMNIVGSVFAGVGIVLYSAELQFINKPRESSYKFDPHSTVLESSLANSNTVSIFIAALQLCLGVILALRGGWQG